MRNKNIKNIHHEEIHTRFEVYENIDPKLSDQAFENHFEHLKFLEDEAILHLLVADLTISGKSGWLTAASHPLQDRTDINGTAQQIPLFQYISQAGDD